MKQFLFQKSQISRLKTFNSYIKRMEAICPLDMNQLFVIKDNKLSVYGHGNGSLGSGFIEASFDVETNDSFFFVIDLTKFIQLLEKAKSDEVSVSMTDTSQLIFKGKDSSSKFTQVVMSLDMEELKEVSTAVTNYRTSNPYKNGIDIDVSKIKTDLLNAASVLGILNVNKFMKLSSTSITTADNVSIIDVSVPELTNGQEVYLHKNLPALLQEVDSFKICNIDGEYWVYIDIASQGISLYFAEPPIDYQSPSASEVAGMLPKDEYMQIEVKSDDFVNALSEFDGIFDSASWRYGQIKFTVDDEPVFKLHFDNMVSCVDTVLKYTILEDTRKDKKSFMFQIPTLHLKALFNDLKEYPAFTMKFSQKPEDILVAFKNEKLSINLVKMED